MNATANRKQSEISVLVCTWHALEIIDESSKEKLIKSVNKK